MQKRYMLLLAGLAITAIGVGLTWLAMVPQPDLDLMSFRRIKLGMSVRDVESIFVMAGEMGKGGEGEVSWYWNHGGNYACISFGQKDGKVKCGSFITPDGKQHWLPRR